MHRQTIMKAIGFILLALLIVLTIVSIREGFEFQHELPIRKLQEAQENWRKGLASQAVDDFISATTMALDCGLRYTVAQPFIDRMRALENAGRYHEALDTCVQAVQILGRWDQEGLVSYDCYALEDRIKCTVVGEEVHCLP